MHFRGLKFAQTAWFPRPWRAFAICRLIGRANRASAPGKYSRFAVFPRAAQGIRRTVSAASQSLLRRRLDANRYQKKRSATPEGCAKVPPKEEVLEDMRRHL